MYLMTDILCSILWKQISGIFVKFLFCMYFFQCMSMIEDMTKERHRLIDEQEKQMDQIKGVSTNVPTD